MDIFSYTPMGPAHGFDTSLRDIAKLLQRGRPPGPEGEPFGHRQVRYEERLGFAITRNLAWDLAGVEEQWKQTPYKASRRLKYQAALGFPITPRLAQRLEERERIESRRG